jgi:c-di-GMP-binding flagellar brake protein YcgR
MVFRRTSNLFAERPCSEENRLNDDISPERSFSSDASPMNCEEHERPINRRRYQRYEIDTQLHVTVLGVEQRGTMRGRSLDISEVGIAGVFVTVWDVGTPVRLEFLVPVTRNPIRVGGVLRSHSGHRYGFEFVDLNPDQREIISRTCRTLALLQ